MTNLLKFAINHGANFINNNHSDVLLLVKREAINTISYNASVIADAHANPEKYSCVAAIIDEIKNDNRQLVAMINGISHRLLVNG